MTCNNRLHQLTIVLFIVSCPIAALSQNNISTRLKNGDIIFQKLACGELCQAILEVTPCAPDGAFNHCGIVHKAANKTYVIEAIGAAVHETSLDTFLLRDTSHIITIARISGSTESLTNSAVTRAQGYIGRPYDDAFLPGDSALYCSELVWEAFRYPKTGKPVFILKPMTFRSPSAKTTFPGWQHYYDDLHIPVPEGVPGINPCAIAASPAVTIYKFKR